MFTLIFMVATAAWNIFSGYSGYLALGHAVFFGMRRLRGRARRAGLARPGRLGRVRAAAARRVWSPALIAIPVGLIALRTRRHTFVVVTIAIFFIFQLAAFNLAFTGGTSGIQLPFAPFSAATTTSRSTTCARDPGR